MHDHACTLIWDVHTCMGHNIVPYAYRIAIPYAYRPIYAYGAEHWYCETGGIKRHKFCSDNK